MHLLTGRAYVHNFGAALKGNSRGELRRSEGGVESFFSPAPSLTSAALEERRRSKEKAGSTRGSYRPSKA